LFIGAGGITVRTNKLHTAAPAEPTSPTWPLRVTENQLCLESDVVDPENDC